MAYQMAATVVTLNDLQGHSLVAGLFKCNPLNVCAAFYRISTDSVLAQFLCISRACCLCSTLVVCLCTKFEVCKFNRSADVVGLQKLYK